MSEFIYKNKDQIIKFIRSHKSHLVLENYFPCYDGYNDCKVGEWFFKHTPGLPEERYIMIGEGDTSHITAINADTGEIAAVSIYDIAPAKINILDHANQIMDSLSKELDGLDETSLEAKILKSAIDTIKEESDKELVETQAKEEEKEPADIIHFKKRKQR